MEIKNIEVRYTIVINGVVYERKIENWTESVKTAQKNGVEFNSDKDVIDWIEMDL